MYCYLDNDYILTSEPLISVNDRGLLLGDGIFETIKANHGQLAFFPQHYMRFKASAKALAIPLSVSEDELLQICLSLLKKNHLQQCAAIRITLTRGQSDRGISISKANPTLLITVNPYKEQKDNNPKAIVTPFYRNEKSFLSQHKTLNYLDSILARKYAEDNGFDEGILINTNNALVCSTIGNLFLVKNDKIITPPLSDGILPGITREAVINCCGDLGIELVEQSIFSEDITNATEMFHTNSLIGVQEFCGVGDHELKCGGEGIVVKAIKQIYNVIARSLL